MSMWLLVEIGPCASSPCLHNGTCNGNYYTDTYICICIDGYIGDRCETPLLCPPPPFPEGVNITLVCIHSWSSLISFILLTIVSM